MGESKKFDLEIRLSDMKAAGTGDPTSLSFYLRVKPQYDPNDKFLDYVTVYPLGEEKAETVERKAADTDQILEDNDKVKLTYIGMKNSSSDFLNVLFWVENKTDETAWTTVYCESVGGTEVSLYGEDLIAPHSSGILDGFIRISDLNGLDPQDIAEFEIFFQLCTHFVNPKTLSDGRYTVRIQK